MIAKLIIANLKGFASRTDIDLAPLTLLYGENSAGKSTILQALRLLREIHVDNTAQRVRGMPFRDLVTNGNTNMPLSLGFECAFDSSASASDILNLCWLSAIEWDPSASLPRSGSYCAGCAGPGS